MKPLERRQRILDYLTCHGKTDVDELASHFKLTEATIRKDLSALETQRQVLRTYGSVVIAPKDIEQDQPIDVKTNVNLVEKQRIGKAAIQLISEGDSIIFDAGSTVLQIIPHLTCFENLSLMTNSLTIFNSVLQLKKSYNLLMSGGTFREKSASFHGYFAESAFIDSTFDILFIGTDGFDLKVGLTTFNEVYKVSSLMCDAAKKIVVLADSSKFERKTPNIVCGLDKIDTVITDSNLPQHLREQIIERGIRLIIA